MRRIMAKVTIASATSGRYRILDGCGMHQHAEQQPLRVDCEVLLAPLDLLGCVLAARPAALRCLHTLGVEDGRGGAGFTPRSRAA